MTRVLILTAGFGEGHNAAARALAAAFDRSLGPRSARVADVFALASPRLNALARRGYLNLINRTPHLWNRIYRWIDRSDFVERQPWLFRREEHELHGLLSHEQPDLVCSTYPLCAFLLNRLAQTRGQSVPHFNVVTDSISIHSLWWRAPCTGWFLPNQDSADVLLRAGIDPALVHVSGFPVPSFFSEQSGRLAPPDLAAGARPRVLHIINSGTRHAPETARRLLTETDWDITCAVGRDERLLRQLTALAATRAAPATILGWTREIPRLLMTHHAVVSKAGGATTQEAIAAHCPMIVSQVVPGQEEGNYELLRRHGAGVLAASPSAVLTELRRAFADHGRVWREWHTALAPLARPDAAGDIVSHALRATAQTAAATA
jgi:processive 1,2-diacylglycerol beta-glucosyltransferase